MTTITPLRPPVVLPGLAHDEHELACVVAGSAQVHVARRTFELGPQRALWIPAGTSHDVVVPTAGLAVPIWLEPHGCPISWADPVEVQVSPQLRALIHYWHQCTISGRPVAPEVTTDLYDHVRGGAARATVPPLPRHPQARLVARALMHDPADRRTLQDWAAELYVVPKTLQRAFRADTGHSFSGWRTRVRLHASLDLLTHGHQVAAVSRAVGYATPGGYITAFRRHYGHTPAIHANAATTDAATTRTSPLP